jgi:hypothetical protein
MPPFDTQKAMPDHYAQFPSKLAVNIRHYEGELALLELAWLWPRSRSTVRDLRQIYRLVKVMVTKQNVVLNNTEDTANVGRYL